MGLSRVHQLLLNQTEKGRRQAQRASEKTRMTPRAISIITGVAILAMQAAVMIAVHFILH
jgi:hypothetical protein